MRLWPGGGPGPPRRSSPPPAPPPRPWRTGAPRGGGFGAGGRGGLGGVGRAAAQAALSRGVSGVPLGSLAISLDDPGYIEGESELEAEFGVGESESAAMVMEHFGHAATQAESEA